ncbi:MAG: hypothetical protein GTO14_21330 [Anaerolineales bacterium]|nr:hypothetical protein [Anaerolineales bacterium]
MRVKNIIVKTTNTTYKVDITNKRFSYSAAFDRQTFLIVRSITLNQIKIKNGKKRLPVRIPPISMDRGGTSCTLTVKTTEKIAIHSVEFSNPGTSSTSSALINLRLGKNKSFAATRNLLDIILMLDHKLIACITDSS